jgi:hypothetical protein
MSESVKYQFLIDVFMFVSVKYHFIIVSLGSINIIDATVIEAKQSRKRKGRNGNNTQDPEAEWWNGLALLRLNLNQ